MKNYKPKKKFMNLTIEEAKKSKKNKEWSFGAVVVKGNRVIAKSGNTIFRDDDPSGHAEIGAMRKAGKKLKSKYLRNCILYSTNEPCPMCTTCAIWAEMKGIVFGANIKDLKRHFKKTGNKIEFFISAQHIISKKYPKDFFLVKNFMRKECKELFEI